MKRLILDLCEEMVRKPGSCVTRRCWYQEGLDLAGSRSVTAAAAYREGGV